MFKDKVDAKYRILSNDTNTSSAWDDDLLAAIYNYTEDHQGLTAKEKEIVKLGIEKHGIYKKLYRGLNGDFSHLEVGDTLKMPGLISCTDDDYVAYKFAKGKSLDKTDRHTSGGAVITLHEHGLPITQGRFNDEFEYLAIGGEYTVKEIVYEEKENIYYIDVV